MDYMEWEMLPCSSQTNMTEKDKTLRDLLGLDTASTPVQTVASVLGGLLFSGGLVGSLGALNDIKYPDIPTQSEGEKVNAATEAQFNADLAGYQSKVEANTTQGLVNRGITDKAVSESAVTGVRSGLSGAYASARAALNLAKLKASTGVSGALVTYKQELAKKQYEAQLKNYASKMGIWGSLGGAATSMLATPSITGDEKSKGDKLDASDMGAT